MSVTQTDRNYGVTGGLAVKAPCVTVSTTDITLSGEQTIGTVDVVAGDRVLVNGQSDQTENGIYCVSATGWTRTPDCDGNRDLVTGTMVIIGSTGSGVSALYQCTTADPVVVGTSAITFQAIYSRNVVYGLTDAEDAAGIVEGSSPGDLVDDSYLPLDPMRYGYDPDYSAASHAALQAAINAQSHEVAGQAGPVIIPLGRGKISDDIRCYYDVSLNPGHNPADRASRPYIIGYGMGSRENYRNTDNVAISVLDFDAGNSFKLNDTAETGSFVVRAVTLENFAIWGANTSAQDPLFIADNQREKSRINLFIGNNADGTAVSMTDCCCHMDISLVLAGDKTEDAPTGMGIVAGGGGGGLMNFHHLSISDFADAGLIGQPYDTGNSAEMFSGWRFFMLDIFQCDGPLWFRHGPGLIIFDEFWCERNDADVLRFTDLAGTNLPSAENANSGIYFRTSKIALTNNNQKTIPDTAGDRIGIVLGDDSLGSDEANGHGKVVIDDLFVQSTPSAPSTAAIRRFNSPENGPLYLTRPVGHSNGGSFLVLEDEAQIAPVIVMDDSGTTDYPIGNRWTDTVGGGGSRIDHWVSFVPGYGSTWYGNLGNGSGGNSGAPDWDFSAASMLPAMLRSSVSHASNPQYINLPAGANIVPFESTILKGDNGTTSAITLYPGAAGDINGLGAGMPLTITGQPVGIRIRQWASETTSNQYVVTVEPNQAAATADLGADPTQSDFNDFLDDLRDAGVISR